MASLPSHAVAEASARDVTLSVDLSSRHERGPLQTGFLHGFSGVRYASPRLDMALLPALKPSFWRIGFSDGFRENYALAKTLNPDVKINLVMSDLLAIRHGGYSALKPWLDWVSYETEIRLIVRTLIDEGYSIDYWDPWNEPDVAGFWSGSCAQAMEMYRRAHHAIRAESSTAKIVGPSVSAFTSKGPCAASFLETFVAFVESENLRFDALSWHEFDAPRDVIAHAAAVRSYYSARPYLLPPEIHINEYSGPAKHLVPGESVHWLQALELAGAAWSSRACWAQQCESGLNGLFKSGNRTPTGVYWVYRAYAALSAKRVQATSDADNVVALAALDEPRGSVALLIGSASENTSSRLKLTLNVKNCPQSCANARVEVTRIPHEPWKGRLRVGAFALPAHEVMVNDGTTTLRIENVFPGDAYVVEIFYR